MDAEEIGESLDGGERLSKGQEIHKRRVNPDSASFLMDLARRTLIVIKHVT